ncbi:MAG: hypothetical protein KDI36_18805, partial [Pseudomonadales bacterium]|nr:hypothetical protein [Pseudomonadales bacterium]
MSAVGDEARETDPQDVLLDLLVVLTRLHQRPFSGESLTAGLPLVNGRLTPELYVRAANNAGFAAASSARAFSAISPHTLPAGITLKNGEVAVLMTLTDEKAGIIRADDFDADNLLAAVTETDRASLDAEYAGTCYLIRPDESKAQQPQHSGDASWFWEVLRKSRGLYAEVIIASLLINIFALVSPL